MTDVHPPRPGSETPRVGGPPQLTISSRSGTRSCPLDRPRIEIGRGIGCDVVLDDPTVSRRHLVLELEAGLVRFRDLGGTNVPLLDGTPCREGILTPGSWLLIGMTRLMLTGPSTGAVRPLAGRDPNQTARLLRQHQGGQVDADPTRTSIATLTALRRPPLTGPHFIAELAPHLLESALELTGRERALLAERATDGTLTVIASMPADMPALAVPSEACGADREPLVLDPWPPGDPSAERIIVPCGSDHLLVLAEPVPVSPRGMQALEIAVAFAAIAERELNEARRHESERRELDRRRFQRSYASRTVEASVRLQSIRRQLTEAAILGMPVRLTGEEGCESEELARYYHAAAIGETGPFVPCYARFLPIDRLTEDLAADVDEHGGMHGCGARARGGTLFVDAPEALTTVLQLRLAAIVDGLRTAPPEHRFRLVLSSSLDRGDAPVLHEALEAALVDSQVLRIPPLRSAPQDAVAIAAVILDDLGAAPDGSPRRLTADAERLLTAYHWPGNTAQLRQVVESAAARTGGDPIDAAQLPAEVRDPVTNAIPVPTLEEIQRAHILRVLTLFGGNKTRTARRLGISPSTLYAKLKNFGLDS